MPTLITVTVPVEDGASCSNNDVPENRRSDLPASIQELFDGIDFEEDGSWIGSQQQQREGLGEGGSLSTNELIRRNTSTSCYTQSHPTLLESSENQPIERISSTQKKPSIAAESKQLAASSSSPLSNDLDDTFLSDEMIAKLGLPKKKGIHHQENLEEAHGSAWNAQQAADISDTKTSLDQSGALLDESRNLLDITNQQIDDDSSIQTHNNLQTNTSITLHTTPKKVDISALSNTNNTFQTPTIILSSTRDTKSPTPFNKEISTATARDDSLSLNESMMRRYGAPVVRSESQEENKEASSCHQSFDETEHQDSPENVTTTQENIPFLTFSSLGPPIEPYVRKTGANEEKYKRELSRSVSNIVTKFRQQNPGICLDFKSLSNQRKEEEKRSVMELISRLTIGHAEPKEKNSLPLTCESRSSSRPSSRVIMPSLEVAVSPITPAIDGTPARSTLFEYEPDQPMTANKTTDSSMTEFTPPRTQSKSKKNGTIKEKADCSKRTEGSISPVEHVRRNRELHDSASFGSPDSTLRISQKRCASGSGRKGRDASRFRMTEQNEFSPIIGDDDESEVPPSQMIPSPTPMEDCSYLSSPGPKDDFPTPGSPISHGRSNTGEIQIDMPDSTSRSSSNNPANDTIETNTRSMNHEKRVRWNSETHRSFLNEMPAKVSLKHGVHYRLNPLRFRKNTTRVFGNVDQNVSPRSEFPDPLDQYSGRLKERLVVMYNWMEQRDENASVANSEGNDDDDDNDDDARRSTTSGIVFGLSPPRAMNIALKLIHNATSIHDKSSPLRTGTNGSELIAGGTLLVVRGKEDLDNWEKIFREGTSRTVITHASLPFTERTNPQAASKCCTFDVVITTFDCLISKDTAIHVDSFGHVRPKKPGFENGWYSSRSSDQQSQESHPRCEQLSILHTVQWRRILFVDVLGRKSYLSKMGTLRAKSAVALKGQSRFIIFEAATGDMKKKSQLEALRKSDKRALKSVAAVLRFPSECGVDYIAAQSTSLLSREAS